MEKNILDVKNLKIIYRKRPVIENLTFSVEVGDIVAIVGENENYIQLLMKTLAGINSSDVTGVVKYFDIKKENLGILTRENLNNLGEKAGTIREKILLSLLETKKDKEIKSQYWNLVDDCIYNLGLSSYKDKDINKLTKWNQYKTLIACLLIQNVTLLYLDVSAEMINARTRIEFNKIVASLSENLDITFFINYPNKKNIPNFAKKVLILKKNKKFSYGFIEDHAEELC